MYIFDLKKNIPKNGYKMLNENGTARWRIYCTESWMMPLQSIKLLFTAAAAVSDENTTIASE